MHAPRPSSTSFRPSRAACPVTAGRERLCRGFQFSLRGPFRYRRARVARRVGEGAAADRCGDDRDPGLPPLPRIAAHGEGVGSLPPTSRASHVDVGLVLKQIAEDSVLATTPETVVFGTPPVRPADAGDAWRGRRGHDLRARHALVPGPLRYREGQSSSSAISRDAIEGRLIVESAAMPSSDFLPRRYSTRTTTAAIAAWFADDNARSGAERRRLGALICRARHRLQWLAMRARACARVLGSVTATVRSSALSA